LEVRYAHGPDSVVQQGVPAGETIEFDWRDSNAYPGTSRKANLIHHGDIPVTIGMFVDPGVFEGAEDPKNRNVEYDAFDARYVGFLLGEIIPEVIARYPVTEDPDRWGMCGGSSGGNCAFTAAWLRPDKFRRVIGCLSSFAQMPDGNPYHELIPSIRRKPLRIFLQAGHVTRRVAPDAQGHQGCGAPAQAVHRIRVVQHAASVMLFARHTTSSLSGDGPTTRDREQLLRGVGADQSRSGLPDQVRPAHQGQRIRPTPPG
jgi:hypothetical protein